MENITELLLTGFGGVWFLFFLVFSWVSYREKEQRATQVALAVGLGGATLFFLAVALPFPGQLLFLGFLNILLIAAIILFWLPIGKVEIGPDTPTRRFDEREIMFARAYLQPGSPEYQVYYEMHPEHEKGDRQTRAQPGLLSPEAKFANSFHFAATDGSFDLTSALRESVNGPIAGDTKSLSPTQMRDFVVGLAHYFGARDVGITELRPYHLYSHVGRGTGIYGEPVRLPHSHAIAFTVEMDFEMVGTAPQAPTSMESARQYVEAARVAVQLANTLRRLGYPARAHIDGNYRVIAPLVARDAGLGEIGRITLLMTPRQGPRVRLGVVTVDLALPTIPREPNRALIDFCNICKKCAENCPSKSLPFEDRQEIDGARRWKLNEETCFRYWNAVGTDCARCMAVCPFSHPDNFMHNLIRWGIARSGAFRRFALWMDNLFYGKKPEPRKVPQWLQVE